MHDDKCKETVWRSELWRSTQCQNNIWEDGYCKQHHPETIAARQDKRDTEFKMKRAADRKDHEIHTLEENIVSLCIENYTELPIAVMNKVSELIKLRET